ncbi:response regulator [Lichenihabitans sp. Uapishka_5]|uniref:response regulator n=1 Tax=Lichenihabitans sp. Uapishka_5 TaxID=3037302 RepID=UPI0029E7E804|nr:response regulator [Lichenihabitans sp. Uapishka_5]
MVDDNALIRMDAVDIVEQAGFRVLDAANVDEALDLLREHHARLQLLFTDVHMPGAHDGFYLAREVSRCWPHIAIVVASGEATPGPTDMPADATFIGKPFNEAVVHHTLRRTMATDQQPGRLRTNPDGLASRSMVEGPRSDTSSDLRLREPGQPVRERQPGEVDLAQDMRAPPADGDAPRA